MPAFDTSAMIYAWDNYPITQFPPVWEWLGKQVQDHSIFLCEVAFEELKKNAPDCHDWLKQHSVQRFGIGNETIAAAAAIEKRLGIVNQQYNQAGVGENDILIIASAQVENHELVANEARQETWQKMKQPARYKIPTVCQLPEVAVPCQDFLQFIRSSGEVFDRSGRK